MVALIKVFALFGVLGAQGQMCVDKKQWKPDVVVQKIKCSLGLTMFKLDSFTASQATCTAQVDNPMEAGKKMSMTSVVAIMSPCCGGTPTVCDTYLLNPCATPSAFKRSMLVDKQSCAMMASMTPAFTASEATCNEKIQIDGNSMPRGALVSHMSACCTSGGDMCAPYMMSPCQTAGDFLPDKVVTSGTMLCKTLAASTVSKFTPSAATCSAASAMKGTTVLQVLLSVGVGGCCGAGGKTVCAPYTLGANLCKDPSKFTPDKTTGKIKCGAMVASLPAFYINTATCAEKGLGQTSTRTVVMKGMASLCCSDAVSACASPPKPTTTQAQTVASSAQRGQLSRQVLTVGFLAAVMAVLAV